jgi:NADP-dependent 3-hydroxy acid dehydrogenase YdfG
MALNPRIRDWKDRRCWIVGASTGIGAALADRLAATGARVAVSSRRADALEEWVARCPKGRGLAVPLDITDAPAFEKAVARVVKHWQGIDLVVFMAGEYRPMRAWELTVPAARAMVEVNVMGCFNGLAAVIPQFLEQGAGTIALVSSVAGYRGLPRSLVYGPTKAAVINLAEALYLDLRPKGIGVCVVNPGFVKTPMTARNDFRMPALIGAPEAAGEIVKGLEAGEFEIHFPKRFTRFLKLLRMLPYGRYFPAVRKATGL